MSRQETQLLFSPSSEFSQNLYRLNLEGQVPSFRNSNATRRMGQKNDTGG